jgi:flagellar biosynthetic protein FliR
MVLPFVGTARVPLRIRLAVGLWLAVALAGGGHYNAVTSIDVAELAVFECALGFVFGLAARIVVSSAALVGTLSAAALGLLMPATSIVDDRDQVAPFEDLYTLVCLCAILLFDLHLRFFEAFIASYQLFPIAGVGLETLMNVRIEVVMQDAWMVGLKLAFPVLALSVIVNAAFGLLNRAIPILPVQFLGAPLLLLSGLVIILLGVSATFYKIAFHIENDLSAWVETR